MISGVKEVVKKNLKYSCDIKNIYMYITEKSVLNVGSTAFHAHVNG